MPVLPEFMAKYPDISLDFTLKDRLPDLIKDKIDLGLCYGEPDHPSYVGRYLCSPPVVLVASPKYLAANGTPACPDDLNAHKIINVLLREGVVPLWTLRERLALATNSHEPVVFRPVSKLNIMESHESAIDAALAGLGVAAVMRRSAAPYLKSGELCQLLTAYDVSINDSRVYLVYPSRKYLPSRVRAFIDFLVNVTGRDGWSGSVSSLEAQVEEMPACSAGM
jgi:DNA-binding transcriptional LysR family regulator